MTPLQKHISKWQKCQACEAYDQRKKVVLCKGKIPCDVLFIGEAPGESEDTLGIPFIGPAGHLLDRIIYEAISGTELEDEHGLPKVRIAFTNIVACIPREVDGDKSREPSKNSIKACSKRLVEFIGLCQPKLIVCVGKLSEKWTPDLYGADRISIVHPAAILRADISQRGLAIQHCIIALRDALEELP